MLKNLQFTLCFYLCLLTSTNLNAATLSILSDGSDGSFTPAASTTLIIDDTLTFNFTDIIVNPGVTVNFDQTGLAANFLGTNDIAINGTLDASLLDLTITTPGRLTIDGAIYAESLLLEASEIYISGILTTQDEISMMAGDATFVDQNAGITSSGGTLTAGDITTINQSTDGTALIGGGGVVLLPSDPITLVPIPAALWLFCSGLLSLIGISRRRKPA